jgi:diketogulonate reductase-like aldo/keto reductase
LIPSPSFIYGTAWKKDATRALVLQALQAGFRAIDTANQPRHYSEALVGEALASYFKGGGKREDLFIQTKFTPVDGQDARIPYDPKLDIPAQVRQSFASSLEHLGVDRVDSFLLHGPYQFPNLSAEDFSVWKTLEEIYRSKKTGLIGVSNFNALQLAQLLKQSVVPPKVVQNRCYANRGWDREVRNICKAEKIIYQGFSLLRPRPY